MGAASVQVFPGTAQTGGVTLGSGSVVTLTSADCDAILQECPDIAAATPIVNSHGTITYAGKNTEPQSIIGATPAYLDIRDWNDLAEGNAFTYQDVRSAAKVCLIGQTVKQSLFDDEDPIGKEIRVLNISVKVVGVLSQKGANMVGWDQDDVVLMPWTTIKFRVSASAVNSIAAAASSSINTSVNTLNNLYSESSVDLYPQSSSLQAADTPQPVRFANIWQILCSARSPDDIHRCMSQITGVLRERHRLPVGVPNDFELRDNTEFVQMLSSTTKNMTALLLCVALISLLVGGVGIMNIMLVSVTERTREIGLRMAVGARAGDILWQFLTEAVILCLLGGAAGIALGRGISLSLRHWEHWPIQASIPAIVASVAVSAIVGIAFGYYPAWKASRLDPIEALRYE
jgi:ABC-type antimicrobial peptide transport system permease subunit